MDLRIPLRLPTNNASSVIILMAGRSANKISTIIEVCDKQFVECFQITAEIVVALWMIFIAVKTIILATRDSKRNMICESQLAWK